MKRLWETLGGARGVEGFLLVVVLAVAGLVAIRGGASPTAGGDAQTPIEARLEGIIMAIDGVGSARVMVTQAADGRAEGVVVVAEGLDSVRACLEVQEAVRALLNIEPSRIRIIGKQGVFGGGLP